MTWKTLKIKEETYKLISEIAEKTKIPKHKIIHTAIVHYLTFHYKSHEREKMFNEINENYEKIAWKIYKFSKSVGHFIENPTKSNYRYITERVEEILKIFENIDENVKNEIKLLCEKIKNLCRRYLENRDKNVLIELNQTCKLVIKLVLLHCL